MSSKILKHPPRPGTDEWRQTMSGSKIATILGLSRFQSPFSLWHEMAGNVEPEPFDEEIGAWGHIAEHSLAEWWKHHNPGWQLNAGKPGETEITYTRDDLPFPNLATLDRRAMNRAFGVRDPRRFHIIECKTARDLADWGRPGDDNAVPADYYAQVLWGMGISGIHQASICVLGPFGAPEIHTVEWSQPVFDGMVTKATEWMQTLESGEEPELSDSLRDYTVIRGLHPDIDSHQSVDVDRDQAVAWLDAITAEAEAKKQAQLAKTQLAKLMGNAKYATVNIPGRDKPVKLADRRAKQGGTPYVQFNKKANLADA